MQERSKDWGVGCALLGSRGRKGSKCQEERPGGTESGRVPSPPPDRVVWTRQALPHACPRAGDGASEGLGQGVGAEGGSVGQAEARLSWEWQGHPPSARSDRLQIPFWTPWLTPRDPAEGGAGRQPWSAQDGEGWARDGVGARQEGSAHLAL